MECGALHRYGCVKVPLTNQIAGKYIRRQRVREMISIETVKIAILSPDRHIRNIFTEV